MTDGILRVKNQWASQQLQQALRDGTKDGIPCFASQSNNKLRREAQAQRSVRSSYKPSGLTSSRLAKPKVGAPEDELCAENNRQDETSDYATDEILSIRARE